jgi:ParB-like chromosome segregation protein Spo0J
MTSDPISAIEWRDAATLSVNNYNPNVVFTPELRLLELSIMTTGWVQPILVSKDGTIIDGFHRSRLAVDSAALKKKYAGKVPCAVVDVSRAEAMLMTIRMNRAKGTHVAVQMSSIIKELIDDHHLDPQEISKGIGATLAEIDLLYQDGVFKMKNIKDYKYSPAWYPTEDVK